MNTTTRGLYEQIRTVEHEIKVVEQKKSRVDERLRDEWERLGQRLRAKRDRLVSELERIEARMRQRSERN